MPTGAMPNTCTCLREARRAAGFQNFGQAGMATHHSPEVIGRHERGEVPLQMNDAIEYANAYGNPAILMSYCGECAIRRELYGDSDLTFVTLPMTTIRVSNRLRKASQYVDMLNEIIDDGSVAADEREGLQAVIDYLQEIETTSRQLMTACMQNGIWSNKKDRPAGSGTILSPGSAHHSE